MPKPIDDLVASVAALDTVLDSAVAFINGTSALVATAVQQAIANGATAEQLAPLAGLRDDLDNRAKAIADAIVANTPTPPAPTPGPSRRK